VTTQYLIDDMNPTGLPQVMEETVNGVVQRRYTYGLQRISETQLINGSWVTSNYVYDADGNVRKLTNTAGVVTDTYDYDAFGNLVNHTGSTPNVYLYKGERYDADLGMYYMRARWYNPATGRFMSRDPEEGDPSNPASLHKYSYAAADPVNNADPTGRAAQPWPLPPPPGPVPVPPNSPQPEKPPSSGAVVEYALILGAVSAGAVAEIPPVTKKVECLYQRASELLGEVAEFAGIPTLYEGEGQCTEVAKNCLTEFPEYLRIEFLPGDYVFDSDGEAFSALQEEVEPNQVRKGKESPATSGPCSVSSGHVPGWHINVPFSSGGGYAGSLVGCPVCEDGGAGSMIVQRWAVK
jgi:RHS repeat-associated protein